MCVCVCVCACVCVCVCVCVWVCVGVCESVCAVLGQLWFRCMVQMWFSIGSVVVQVSVCGMVGADIGKVCVCVVQCCGSVVQAWFR